MMGKPEGRRPLGRPRRRCEIILKWIFENWNGREHGLDRSGSRKRQVVGFCEGGNEPSGSIKCWEFLE